MAEEKPNPGMPGEETASLSKAKKAKDRDTEIKIKIKGTVEQKEVQEGNL